MANGLIRTYKCPWCGGEQGIWTRAGNDWFMLPHELAPQTADGCVAAWPLCMGSNGRVDEAFERHMRQEWFGLSPSQQRYYRGRWTRPLPVAAGETAHV